MIKAKKGLLITLFAAMMVFAFGATSVFADTFNATAVTWDDDYECATVEYLGGNTTADATWNLINSGANRGVTQATIAEYIPVGNGDFVRVASATDRNRYFINLDDAEIGYLWYGTFYGLSKKYSVDAYATIPTDGIFTGYTFEAPDRLMMNLLDEDGNVIDSQRSSSGTISGWAFEITVDPTVTEPTKEAPVFAEFTATGTADMDGLSADHAKLVGKCVNYVEVVANPIATNTWYEDVFHKTGDSSGNWTPAYDAAEHVAYVPERKGYTTQYQQYDAKTGLWTNIDKVTWKDAAPKANYRAAFLQTEIGQPVLAPITLDITVTPCTADLAVAWTADNNYYSFDKANLVLTEEQAADPAALLEFAIPYDADLDAFKAYFNDFYDIVVKPSAADPNKQTWKVQKKATVSADVQAKHATLIGNYSKIGSLDITGAGQKMVEVTGPAVSTDTLEDIVDITLAPSMTYHVKKAKKMKKTQSFTVEAQTKSGKAVTWVLQAPNKKIVMDAATGKISVKKGLKKGTYKIKVTARTEKGGGYLAAQDVAEMTIKVKK